MFIGGVDYYGRVDSCVGKRGRAHIHTRFGHTFWIPLLPVGGATLYLADADGVPGPSIEIGFEPRSLSTASSSNASADTPRTSR